MNGRLTFAAVDRSNWSDLERLFEQRGSPHYCWCTLWRTMPSKDRKDKKAKKCALKSLVLDGVPVGLLAYANDAPVAWCSVAPKGTFRPLGAPASTATGEDVWSMTCFFVCRPHRGQGLTSQMIEAGAAHAKANGGRVLEAYPVAADSPSYRFMGLVPQFERAGFRSLGSTGARRYVMQRRLD